MELDELCKFKSPLLLLLLSIVFQGIYVKKVGGWCNSPGKLRLSNRFGFLSYRVDPSIWPRFSEIGEMACITPAWSSRGHAYNIQLAGVAGEVSALNAVWGRPAKITGGEAALRMRNFHSRLGRSRVAVPPPKQYPGIIIIPASQADTQAEMLKADGGETSVVLNELFHKIWVKEEIPENCPKGLIIKLPNKGDLKSCHNWRGIILLSAPGNVLRRININRIRDVLDDKLRKEQAGFRQWRGVSTRYSH